MNTPVKILIVEDEMLIGANISMILEELGYEISGLVPRAEDALLNIKSNKPDIILLDIQLKGNMDGIALAEVIQQTNPVPVIFLTANSDEAHFNKAKETNPYAFLSKPFKKRDLQRALELTINRLRAETKDEPEESSVVSDRIFVRDHEKLVKIAIQDIQYIEAERNYCRICSNNKDHILTTTLKSLEEKLPSNPFLRIHRSFIVNLHHIDEVGLTNISVAGKTLPVSKSYRDDLLKRLQKI
ncbi:LytR/AlgR family response regulator transcription factor [Jiulongibacter sediminis]|uniref:Transcriptional regulator n=1 Tax=Jiulongibacter sediminis TaxID=1605367 RepID=A0A0P7C2G9_9BACT|nr:LytTR family transcriptional regulator DNA-binding domain-containing protein [Jiulongibacter sediminis]KPM48240.1 transcriptional regulator [Jiulongibacter sediminis]TBX24782.1 transcriptional regulator [Jiulongibacter sediminis]